jgi:HAD superfamily hydrolase (TIGR01509 family)
VTRPVIFLDDGGVMNENRRRAGQWQRLVGEFFVPRLGGTPDGWISANRAVAEWLFDPDNWEARLRATTTYAEFDRAYHLDWMRTMCTSLGLPTPPDEEAIALAHAATEYVTHRVRAAFPGVVEAIRTLHARGYTLHTASGEASRDLDGYLTGMGVRECFGRLYGPDLVDIVKAGPEYYARLLADAGVDPPDALIVDDNPMAAGWAASAGARTVLVGTYDSGTAPATYHIAALADLPSLLARNEE